MAIEKKFILNATLPKSDGVIRCIFEKSIVEDGVNKTDPDDRWHSINVDRFVGPNKDIPSNRPYIRHQLDLAADAYGFERCTYADWQTILDVCQAVWGSLPPDPDWTPPAQ